MSCYDCDHAQSSVHMRVFESVSDARGRVTIVRRQKLPTEAWEVALESECGDTKASAGSTKNLNHCVNENPGMLEVIKGSDFCNKGNFNLSESNCGPSDDISVPKQNPGQAPKEVLMCKEVKASNSQRTNDSAIAQESEKIINNNAVENGSDKPNNNAWIIVDSSPSCVSVEDTKSTQCTVPTEDRYGTPKLHLIAKKHVIEKLKR